MYHPNMCGTSDLQFMQICSVERKEKVYGWLKNIYNTPTKEAASLEIDLLEQKWGGETFLFHPFMAYKLG